MKLPNYLKDKHIEISDFYALKIKALWAGLKQEHISFWMLCIYFFFEYVRPQSVYPVIDVLPYARIFLALTIISAFADPSVKWVSNVGNKLIVLFAMVAVLSGLFAFKPMVAWDNHTFLLNWVLVYFLMVCIINTEKRLFLFICAFLLFNLKMSQHGFFSWAQRGFTFASWGLSGSPGWFQNSGEFSLEMLIFMPLAIAFIIALKERWGKYQKWALYFLPISAAASIIGASSRGGQLGLVAIGIWLLLKSKRRIKAMVLLSVIGLALFYLLASARWERMIHHCSEWRIGTMA
ncbi:MAG: hypothetical protein IPK65_08605 [Gammaproteobacteria bacterium]|nr:hypothetical protein [Gammaproteobacteria bacterium]